MKYFMMIALVAIVASLGAALLFLLKSDAKDASRSRKMASALALRVGLSILLFISILVAWKLGYLHPTGIPLGR